MWESLYPIALNVLNAILIGIGGLFVAFLVTQIAARTVAKWFGPTWNRFVSGLLGLGIIAWTMKLVLDSAGAEGLAVIIITAGTAAFALGSTMMAEDLVAGVSLFFAHPYEVGDWVLLADRDGKVISVSLFLTVLENEAGDRIYIRNAEVTRNSIIRYARPVNN
jgi:small conductance mechanosensitive channel